MLSSKFGVKHHRFFSYSNIKRVVGVRLCTLKMMLHLSKNRDVSVALARTEIIPLGLVNIANKMELVLVANIILCVATVTNLARHPENAEHLVYDLKGLVPTLLCVLLRDCRIIARPSAICTICTTFLLV